MSAGRSRHSASLQVEEAIQEYHTRSCTHGRCGAMHMQRIAAAASTVWAMVRQFDRPQGYKRFIKSCQLVSGNGRVGSVREVRVVSGLPAGTSTERLELLDERQLVMSFSIVGGDHRLKNYRSTTTVHEGTEGPGSAIMVESYVVDVPVGSTEEETCIFADTIVRCNLKSLAEVVETRARQAS